MYITELYKETLTVHRAEKIKMSNPKVLKVNEDFAQKVISKMSPYTKIKGIVNSKGNQKLF